MNKVARQSSAATFLLQPVAGARLQLEFSTLAPDVLHNCHRLVFVLLLRVYLYQHLSYLFEGLADVLPRLRTHLQVLDSLGFADLVDVFLGDLLVTFEVALVAQQQKLYVGNCIFLDLAGERSTSLSQ
jgi:hypothetical protein